MEGRPLADRFAPHPWVVEFIGRGPSVGVGGDVADAVAARLDGVHADAGQVFDDIGRIAQLDPVELEVGAGGEVSVALVVGARDPGELAQLRGVEAAIGDGDAQHVGVQLQI